MPLDFFLACARHSIIALSNPVFQNVLYHFFLCFRLKFMNKETQKTYKVCCADFAILMYKQLLLHSDELCPCSLLNTALLTRMAKWRLAPRILNFATKWQWVLIFAPWSLSPRYLLHMKLGGPQNPPAPSMWGGGRSLAMPVLERRLLDRPIRRLDTVPLELTWFLVLRLWGNTF